MTYRYEGFSALGVVQRGCIEADSEGDAAGKLREQKIHVQKLEPDGPEPMRTVLPGGPPLAAASYTGPVSWSGVVNAGVGKGLKDLGWKDELRAELKRIAEVVSYARSLPGVEAADEAIQKATESMIVDALRTAKDNLGFDKARGADRFAWGDTQA